MDHRSDLRPVSHEARGAMFISRGRVDGALELTAVPVAQHHVRVLQRFLVGAVPGADQEIVG